VPAEIFDTRAFLEYYQLDVREMLPLHFPPMTHTQTPEFIKGGTVTEGVTSRMGPLRQGPWIGFLIFRNSP
jgi:hypothetical protein